MNRISIPLLVLVASAVAASSPATAPSGAGWQQLETANFIIFSNLNEAATKEIGLFEPYALPDGQSGYFAPHKHANFAAVVGDTPADTLPVVYRQYLHDLINNNVPQVPLWFKYGLAEIFSSFQADGSVAQVALPIGGAEAENLGLVGGGRMSVSDVLATESLPSDSVRMNAFVQGSWALVHYLLVDDDERFAASRRFIDELEENPTSDVSITEILDVGVDTLQAAACGNRDLMNRSIGAFG